MKVFKSSCSKKTVVILKNVDLIRKSYFLNVRAVERTKEFPQIVVYVRGKEIVLTYSEGEEYTRDREFDALTKALEEYHG